MLYLQLRTPIWGEWEEGLEYRRERVEYNAELRGARGYKGTEGRRGRDAPWGLVDPQRRHLAALTLPRLETIADLGNAKLLQSQRMEQNKGLLQEIVE